MVPLGTVVKVLNLLLKQDFLTLLFLYKFNIDSCCSCCQYKVLKYGPHRSQKEKDVQWSQGWVKENTEKNIVLGCTSNSWIHLEKCPGLSTAIKLSQWGKQGWPGELQVLVFCVHARFENIPERDERVAERGKRESSKRENTATESSFSQ